MGWGRTCAGAAVERVDPEHEAYLDGEHQGEHDPAGVGRARGQLARRWEGGARHASGRGKEGGAYVEELTTWPSQLRNGCDGEREPRARLVGRDVQDREEVGRHQAVGSARVSGSGARASGEGTHSCWKSPR